MYRKRGPKIPRCTSIGVKRNSGFDTLFDTERDGGSYLGFVPSKVIESIVFPVPSVGTVVSIPECVPTAKYQST